MQKWSQFVLCLFLAVPAVGQTNSATPAGAAHIAGKVTLRATVKNGVVVKTEVLSKADVAKGQRFLESPSVENLKTWRFAPDMTGTLTVSYTYEISGTETEQPTNASIEILPSLDVKITVRPVKPTCNDCRSSTVPTG